LERFAKIWEFISKPQNLAALIAIGGGIGFLIKEVMMRPAPPAKAPVEQATPTAQAISAPPASPAGPTNQTMMVKGSANTAVNAAPGANVTITSGTRK
jgi:hypothetical protein